MRTPRRLEFILLIGAALLGTAECRAEQPERPNIVLILADDMGFSDAGCYGGEIDTPNLDRLAAGGLRFTRFYNTGRCCPTRASLLTGLYPHQAGVGGMTFDRGLPGYRGTLRRDAVTIAEALRTADYRTMMVGKWHLSPTENRPGTVKWVSHLVDRDQPFSDPDTYPVNRGFDEHYGTIWGVVDYFDPFSLVHNTEPIESVPDDYYYTDALSDRAVEYVEEYGDGERPFFLYIAHTAPHWPLHALPEDIARYEDTYKVGWDAIRRGRYERMIEMGLLDPDAAPLSPRIQPDRRWEDNPHREWDARAMAVHAAMIHRMDRGIGRLLDKLEEQDQLDNTLILFLSDNGASPEDTANYGPGFDRPSHTRDGREINYMDDKERMPGPQTTFGSIGPMWANASNTPFRYWKRQVYEGGVCTPLIAHWPAGITADRGSITRQAGHVIDIMATCLDVAGARYPTTHNGETITPMEGKPLTPIFRGEQRDGHEAIFFEHLGARAVRSGGWKLVSLPRKPWELYHLAADRTELKNLADDHPDRVEDLAALWNDWAERTGVLPRPD